MKKSILSRGKDGVYLFIKSIARGIMQIEDLGIYYFDMTFRNIVLEDGQFKFIDFDHAIVVKNI